MIVSRSSWFLTLVVVVALTAAAVLPLLVETESRLVLYCAHDQALAADVIRRFETEIRHTGGCPL